LEEERVLTDLYLDSGKQTADAIIGHGNVGKALPEFERLFEDVEKAMRKVSDTLEQGMRDSEAQAHRSSALAKTSMVAVFVLGLLVSLGGGYFFTGRITKPVDFIAAAARSIAAGDTEIELPASGRTDEIGHLQEASAGWLATTAPSVWLANNWAAATSGWKRSRDRKKTFWPRALPGP